MQVLMGGQRLDKGEGAVVMRASFLSPYQVSRCSAHYLIGPNAQQVGCIGKAHPRQQIGKVDPAGLDTNAYLPGTGRDRAPRAPARYPGDPPW